MTEKTKKNMILITPERRIQHICFSVLVLLPYFFVCAKDGNHNIQRLARLCKECFDVHPLIGMHELSYILGTCIGIP